MSKILPVEKLRQSLDHWYQAHVYDIRLTMHLYGK